MLVVDFLYDQEFLIQDDMHTLIGYAVSKNSFFVVGCAFLGRCIWEGC